MNSFTIEQSEFLQLSPIGVFHHTRGLQQVDASALAALAKNFNSFIARLGRRFAGIPFYIGHPDVPGFESIYPDRKAYGWIMNVEAREDGLYGLPKWSKAGRELIENGHFKFLSPYWEAANIGTKDGKPIFRPTALISVGLTNQPNIPVLPLANGAGQSTACLLGRSLPMTVSTGPELIEPQSNASLNDLDYSIQPNLLAKDTPAVVPEETASSSFLVENTDPTDRVDLKAHSSGAERTSIPDEIPNQEQRRSASLTSNSVSSKTEDRTPEKGEYLHGRLAAVEQSVLELNFRLINSLIDSAIASARILPSEREFWLNQLGTDFESASARIANTQPKVNVHSRTSHLTPINTPPPAGSNRTAEILRLVNSKMQATGTSYHQAWIQTRNENPNLFA